MSFDTAFLLCSISQGQGVFLAIGASLTVTRGAVVLLFSFDHLSLFSERCGGLKLAATVKRPVVKSACSYKQ